MIVFDNAWHARPARQSFFERTLPGWIRRCLPPLSRKVCSLSVLGTSAFPPLRTRRRVVAWSMPGTSKPVASWEGAHTDVTFRWGYPRWRRHQILLTHLGSRSRGRSPAWSGVAWLWWYYCEGMEAALTRAHLHSTFSRGVGGWFFSRDPVASRGNIHSAQWKLRKLLQADVFIISYRPPQVLAICKIPSGNLT